MIENRQNQFFEENLNYKERRSIDLVNQVLNNNSNMYQENKNIADLFKYYGKILLNPTSKEFFDSMKKTFDIFINPQNKLLAINGLKKDRVNSFLIIPLKAFNHMFAAIVRKTSEDYSFTIVNKGYRMPNRNKYEEFIIPKSKINGLISLVDNGMGEFAVESFYREFEKQASEKYKLNIFSNNQKTGNCFIKEPETAIKFAYSTHKFSSDDLKSLRQTDLLKTFRPKWGVPTYQMHKLFVREVQRDNPNANFQLEEKLQVYLQNKAYRESLKSSMDNSNSFQNAFPLVNIGLLSNKQVPNICHFSNVNMDTIRQHTPEIHALVKKNGSPDLIKTFFTLLDFSTNEDIEIYFDKRENFSELTKKISEVEKFFPVLSNEVKREFHLYYLIKSNGLFENKKDYEKALSYVQKANKLYPYNARAHFYEGYYTTALANNATTDANKDNLYLKAIKSLSESIRLKPDFGDSYLMRSRAYTRLGKTALAHEDFNKSTKYGCVIIGHGPILHTSVTPHDGKKVEILRNSKLQISHHYSI